MDSDRLEILTKLVEYFSRRKYTDPQIDKEAGKLVSEAKVRLAHERASEKRMRTKDFIREHYRGWWGEELEEQAEFIRWLEKADWCGHQQFLLVCGRCRGSGECFFLDSMRPCFTCNGEKTVTGPFHCADKDCGRSRGRVHLSHPMTPLGPPKKTTDIKEHGAA